MLAQLFWIFFNIGLFSIGGGYAIIPLIQEQVVFQQGWISERVFTDIITISQMTPGPLAVNTSTFVGIQIAGIPGAIIATVSTVISGIVISLVLYEFFKKYGSSSYVLSILNGLKASSLGLIIAAAATIALLTFFGTSTYQEIDWLKDIDFAAVILFCGSLFCIRKYKLNPITLMVISGLLGLVIY
ncbi:chromate transporter [Enterococcus sp. LJL128]|uniref:chromate transporter n=1 Tax=Enterococcus sp. LJL51 TaxID=3416656 RepID=UPI003CF84D48